MTTLLIRWSIVAMWRVFHYSIGTTIEGILARKGAWLPIITYFYVVRVRLAEPILLWLIVQ